MTGRCVNAKVPVISNRLFTTCIGHIAHVYSIWSKQLISSIHVSTAIALYRRVLTLFATLKTPYAKLYRFKSQKYKTINHILSIAVIH